MVFLANLGVNPHVCSRDDNHQVASAKALRFLDIGKPGPAPKGWDWAPEGCEKNPHFRIGNRVVLDESFPDGNDPSIQK
ncbi:hypothetical protein TRIP_B40360 [uncultured Desulfatiglans sp.]|uniref:Uncharacterized protein n=1 Tax=Uncultured Desulfatiglans sp. TaxID=1748965 RepID=A0A653AEV8_UNCDX|nr:hypothetical protein TRIP_B40360 [uncultured Desulfatiglans sp.]